MELDDTLKAILKKSIKIETSDFRCMTEIMPEEQVSFTLLKFITDQANEIISNKLDSINTDELFQ